MSFEKPLMEALGRGKTSKRLSVKQVALSGTYALATRMETLTEVRAIDADQAIAPADKMATKKAKAANRMRELHDGRMRLVAAQTELQKTLPPIPQADSAGTAAVDSELRSFVRALPTDKRGKLSDAARMAIARGPVELSGLVPSEHARIVEGVRRELYPEVMADWDKDAEVVSAAEHALDAAIQTHKEALNLGAGFVNYAQAIGAKALV